jgi:serine protease
VRARLRVIASLVVLVLLLGGFQSRPVAAGGPIGSASAAGRQPVTQLIVKYRTPQLANRAQAALPDRMAALSRTAGVSLQYRRPMSGGAHVLSLPAPLSDSEARAVAARLEIDPDVEFAEPDEILQPFLTPNDTYYSYQWDLFDPQGGVDLPGAWDLTTGASRVVIAVLDTGIVNHADLAGRILPGYNFISEPFMAGNSFGPGPDASDLGDFVTAADLSNELCLGYGTRNSSWHGSHVAGTIAASSNNNRGVTGINWVSQIEPVRVLGKCGGLTSDLIDAMRWAAGIAVPGVPSNPHPAQILNMSLGGTGACPPDLQQAVDDVVSAGKLIVVAAGNGSTDMSNTVPANCSGVLPVAATTIDGSLASYSNYGSGIAISAPGGDSNGLILSTLNTGTQGPVASPAGDTYGAYEGTSMATPHVAAVASLIWSARPDLSLAQVRQTLQSSARPFPANSNCATLGCGAGIVDAYAAISSVAMPAVSTLTPPFVEAGSSDFTLTVDGSYFLQNVQVRWNGTARPTTWVNSKQLHVSISAADVAQIGSANITVVNPTTGLTSDVVKFIISGPLTPRGYFPLVRHP